MKKVYLDNCVYNRPFDDLTQERIFIEANAFVLILAWMTAGDVTTICSDALTYENEHHPDPEKKARVKTYFSMAKSHVSLSDAISQRAREIEQLGLDGMDALHIAFAEHARVDYFITCDYDMIKACQRVRKEIRIPVVGILEFIKEVMEHEIA